MSQLDQLAKILGYNSYHGYIDSPHWKDFKCRWFEQNQKKCDFCGAVEGVQLHHQTYVRLGRERFKDVQPLCGTCHRDEHNRFLREGYYPHLPCEAELRQFRNKSKKRSGNKIRKTDMRPWCSGCGKRIVISKRLYALEKLAFERRGLDWSCTKCRCKERLTQPIAKSCTQIRKKIKRSGKKDYERNLFAAAFLKCR